MKKKPAKKQSGGRANFDKYGMPKLPPMSEASATKKLKPAEKPGGLPALDSLSAAMPKKRSSAPNTFRKDGMPKMPKLSKGGKSKKRAKK